MLIVSEYIISVTSSTRLIATVPGGFASINMEVNPPSMTFTGYWTRRGLDGIERRIVIDDVKYKLPSTEHIIITSFDANDVGFYTLNVTNGVDSGHNESPVIVKLSGTYYSSLDIYGISVLQMTMNMFHLSQTLPGPFLIHDLSPDL